MARELANLKNYLGDTSAEITAFESEKVLIEAEKAQFSEALEKFDVDSRELNNAVYQRTRDLKDLQETKENSLRSYGKNIPEALKTLQSQMKSFEGEVLGPIGRYLKLKDQKWQEALDAVIGNLMPDFIVTSFRDSNRLKKILFDHRWYAGPARFVKIQVATQLTHHFLPLFFLFSGCFFF